MSTTIIVPLENLIKFKVEVFDESNTYETKNLPTNVFIIHEINRSCLSLGFLIRNTQVGDSSPL